MSETATCITFGKHGARVMIEGKEIPHYAIHIDSDKKEVTSWIASEAGKTFSVIWLELDVKYPTASDLYLDGHPTTFSRRRDSGRIVFQYVNVSESSRAPFVFSPLVVTDDDTYLDTSPSQSIGEIKLVISRTTIPQEIARIPRKQRTFRAPPHSQIVHERSKKAIAHRVDYGTVEIPRRKKESRTRFVAKPVETLATFIFKYRPLEMLVANDIVPRNPEPQEHALDTPSTSEIFSGKGKHSRVKKETESGPGTDDSDEDSMREKALLAEVRRCQAEVERIRKARGLGRRLEDSDSDRPKKKLKKEEKPLFTPGEIIDLT